MKAKEKLIQYGLPALTDAELLEIIKFKGSTADYYQSPQYKAAKELQRRQENPDKVTIKSSGDAFKLMSFLEDEDFEQFWAIFLNRRNQVIQTEFISKGSATGTVVSIQNVIKRALEVKAQNLILVHNHPSGNPQPSDQDKRLTNKLKEAATIFEMGVLDHTIISKGKYFSFADEGLM